MLDPHTLKGLLEGYIAGDLSARKVLLDFLDDAGDARAETVRREPIDWDALAVQLTHPSLAQGIRMWRRPPASFSPHIRWQIDCARVGSTATPEVAAAVAAARRLWLRGLFPELDV
jgi:hypothetical protein